MKLQGISEYDIGLPDYIDRDNLQRILCGLNSANENTLEDMKWEFPDVKIDFSPIKSLEQVYPFFDKEVIVHPVWLAKILFLSCIDGLRSSMLIRGVFESILKTFCYISENNIRSINKSNLQEYLSYCLMNGLSNGKVVGRLEPLSYAKYQNGISPSEWYNILRENFLPKVGFSDFISPKMVEKGLKDAIETLSAGELTLRDWKEGGSFNHLTLDYGRYYVEHCEEFFKKNINIAIALQYTLKDAVSIARKAGVNSNDKNLSKVILPAIGHFLSGKQVHELKPNYAKKYSVVLWLELQRRTFVTFQEKLCALSVVDELTSDQSLYDCGCSIGIKVLNDFQKEWLRVLVEAQCDILLNQTKFRLIELSTNEITCIKEIVGESIDIDNAILYINQAVNNALSTMAGSVFVPTLDFYKLSGIEEKGVTSTYVYNFIKSVGNAGIIQFVALTGWRESEFGFSLNDINIKTNLDLIDQYVHPIRYEIKWVVPKTNGPTKLEREILRSAYRYAIQLSVLISAGNDDPCLYKTNASAKEPKNSTSFIKTSVGTMWRNFVKNYNPFKKLLLIEERQSLMDKGNLNSVDRERFVELSERYVNENWSILEKNQELKDAYRRATNEFDRVMFLINYDDRRKAIWEYRQGIIAPEYKKLFDNYLSDEKKEAIRNLQTSDEINIDFSRTIVAEILEDCLYPTPHAFRHMWAEAVYRRFDGDVGWMIRSNFKHISQNMWLAYIRNKDNRRLNDRVKRKVISSLLKNYIRKRESDNDGNVGEFGNDYAGAMNDMLRRLLRNTKTWTIDELDRAIDHFALTEIEDIKSNPWGFCILKKRHQNNAKCAEMGIPQRQNASPEYCLGCQNNLSQAGNIDGILLGISNHLNVLRSLKAPSNFLRQSYETVKNSLPHLKKLNAEQNIIDLIEDTLTGAKHVVKPA